MREPAETDLDAILAEVRTTKDTADRVANGESTDEADDVRVLAGLIRQLAEQVERLVEERVSARGGDPTWVRAERDMELEEDRTPQDAPAAPLNDRAAS